MKIGQTSADRTINATFVAIASVVILLAIYPMYFVVVASFSSAQDIANGSVWLFPKHVTLIGYRYMAQYARLWLGYGNTIFYTLLGTAINLVLMLPAGYALSRKDFVLKRFCIMYFTITMFINGGLIPTYFVVQRLGLLDSVWSLVLPGSVSVFYVILTRTFFQSSIPQELLDAAVIDGCGDGRFFVSIVLPLSKAIVAVIGLYCAVGHWNSYFNALIYIRDPQLVPLQLVLRDLLISNSMDASAATSTNRLEQQQLSDLIKYCVIVASTLPVILVYPFIQKYFMQGTMIGSIKG